MSELLGKLQMRIQTFEQKLEAYQSKMSDFKQQLKIWCRSTIEEGISKSKNRGSDDLPSSEHRLKNIMDQNFEKLKLEQVKQIQTMSNNLNQNIDSLRNQLKKQENQMYKLQNELMLYVNNQIKNSSNDSFQVITNSQDNLYSMMRHLEQQLQSQSKKIQNNQYIIKKIQKPLLKEIEFVYGNHPKNMHQNDFRIEHSLYSTSIQKVSDFKTSSEVNYIKKGEIPFNAITHFTVCQVVTKSSSVMVGITTSSIFQNKSIIKKGMEFWDKKKKESIAYSSYRGKIYFNDEIIQGGRSVKDNELINLCVNTSQWKLTWSIRNPNSTGKDQILFEAEIPLEMRGKNLYLMINMRDKGDIIDILMN